jgi:hypothetical protein
MRQNAKKLLVMFALLIVHAIAAPGFAQVEDSDDSTVYVYAEINADPTTNDEAFESGESHAGTAFFKQLEDTLDGYGLNSVRAGRHRTAVH